MKIWSSLSLAGMISAAPILCAEPAAAAAPKATSGYAEITAPDDADSVAIVPRPEIHHPNSSYAIETEPDQAAHGSKRQIGIAGAPRVLASLPAGPPLAVEIRFDPRRADNAGRADRIAATLARDGIVVRAIGPAAFPVSDGVGFVFAEDEAAATEIARHLAGSLGHAAQLHPDARRAGEATPGTIEIMLGNDRGTS